MDFVIGFFPIINSVYSLIQIPVKFGKSLWGVFIFLLKIFPKAAVLIQITFLYSRFLQKFGL